MKNLEDVIFIDNLPTIDLHGFDRDYAKLAINEFIKDNKKMGNNIIVIIHGVGLGIIKKVTFETLKSNKSVLDYKVYYNNTGMTLALISID